jgi:chemotaxis protein CheC
MIFKLDYHILLYLISTLLQKPGGGLVSSSELINEAQQDLLKELANIGVGNAVTALSSMLGDQRIEMAVPEVRVTPLQDVPDSFGDPENTVAATYCEAECPAFGLVIVFVLPLDAAQRIVAKILPERSDALEEMEQSLLMELGNIITGSYLSALSFMTNLTYNASPPRLGIDMAGAVLGTVIAETTTVDDQIILLKTELNLESEGIEGSVLILPDSGSLLTLFDHLGNMFS